MASPTQKAVKPNKSASKLAKSVIDSVRNSEIEDEMEIDEDIASQDLSLSDEAEREGYDVFEACHKKAMEKGEISQAFIKKDGEFLCVKKGSYSLPQLQADYGAGSYKITVKEFGTGKILGHQVISIAGAPVSNGHDEDAEEQGFGGSKFGTMEFMDFMDKKAERIEARAREQSQQQSNVMAQLFQTVLQVSGQTKTAETGGNTQMFQMMMELNKSNMDAMRQMNENFNRSFEKLSDRLNQVATQKPKDEFGPLAIMKMLQDAETRGMTFIEKMNEKVEKKAEERAELLAAANGDGEETEKGMWGTLKGFAPLFMEALKKVPTQQPQLPGQVSAQEVSQMRAQENEHYRQLQLKEQNRLREARKAQIAAERGAPAPNRVRGPAPGANGAGGHQNTGVKEAIQALVVPVIAESLNNRESAGDCAKKCTQLVEGQQIPKKTVLDNFSLQDILGVARHYQLPEEAFPWLEEFHGHIVAWANPVIEKVERVVEPLPPLGPPVTTPLKVVHESQSPRAPIERPTADQVLNT